MSDTNLPEVVVVSTAINTPQVAVVRCIESIRHQKYKNVRQIYIANDKETASVAEAVAGGPYSRIEVVRAVPAKPALQNLEEAIEPLRGDEIVVCLDGDDWLISDDSIQVLVDHYLEYDPWITYGQFLFPNGTLGFAAPYPSFVIEKRSYRHHPWLATHLRTFRAGLWKAIPKDRHFMNGEYIPLNTDLSAMIPMLEMAGHRQLFIPNVLCFYNSDHSWEKNASEEARVFEKKVIKHICSREPLKTLEEQPW